MQVTYTGKLIVGGSGIGTTAWHQVKPLFENIYLEKVYCEGYKCDVPEKFFETIPLPTLNSDFYTLDLIFDSLVSLNIEKSPEIIQTWGSHCLHTLREFPEAISIVNLYSAHPLEQSLLLRQEYATFNVEYTNPLLKKFTKELEMCDYIFIPSEFILNSLRKHGLEHKAKLVPFGVDLEKFKPAPKTNEKYKVIFVGGNWLRKGLVYLLSAWKLFMSSHKDAINDAELIVAGCDVSFKDLPLNVKVGWVDDLVKEYQNSDIFCLPAIEDGCPLATYEAMACGLPVIITNTTGTYQHVFSGTNGFVIQPKSIKEIYDKIVYFYENRSEIKRMGQNSRKMVEAFPWERHEKEYLKFIEGL